MGEKVMYYNKIYQFIKDLNSDNIEKFKPQLTKYMIELMLSVKDYDDSISLEDLELMLDIVLLREEFQCELESELKEKGLKLGLLTDKLMGIYREFTNIMVKNGYIHNAISLTKRILKSLGCISTPMYLLKKKGGFNEENLEYIESIEYLNDLQEEIRKHLNQDINNIPKEYFNVLGLIEYVRIELEEDLNDVGKTIMEELKNKSLDDFNREDHTEEYKGIFKKEYIEELKRRKYEWGILSSELKENYFIEELYKELHKEL